MSRLEVREATQRERARCLWVLDQIMAELRAGLRKKLLVESEIHVVKVKVQLAQAIVDKARRAIVSGAKPKGATPTPDPGNGTLVDEDGAHGEDPDT